MKLNLGCGNDIRKGYINVDFFNSKAEEKVDLINFPWPFKDNSIDEILMNHVLEHLPDTERTMREIHRILKVGGIFHGQVPFGWSDNGITEYGHVHLFHWLSFKSMEKIGFASWAQPTTLKQGDLNYCPARIIRDLIPFRCILSRFILNMYDVIDFKLVKL